VVFLVAAFGLSCLLDLQARGESTGVLVAEERGEINPPFLNGSKPFPLTLELRE
jgi:hypothetical protein